MKNTIKLFGISAFIAIIGFSMTACPMVKDYCNDFFLPKITYASAILGA